MMQNVKNMSLSGIHYTSFTSFIPLIDFVNIAGGASEEALGALTISSIMGQYSLPFIPGLTGATIIDLIFPIFEGSAFESVRMAHGSTYLPKRSFLRSSAQ